MTYQCLTVEMFYMQENIPMDLLIRENLKQSSLIYLILFNLTKKVSRLLMTMFNLFVHC